MSTTRPAAGWIREQDLGPVVVPEARGAETAIRSGGENYVPLSSSPSVAPRSALLGTHGGLDRLLIALIRQLNQSPTTRAKSRASADRLVETIRVLSSL